MTAALRLSSRDKVLEVGTGSGYQAAVLAQLAHEGMVVTVERLPELAARAEATLLELDYRNVVVEMAGPPAGMPGARDPTTPSWWQPRRRRSRLRCCRS